MATFGLAVERIHQLLGPVTVPGASQETFVRTIFGGEYKGMIQVLPSNDMFRIDSVSLRCCSFSELLQQR